MYSARLHRVEVGSDIKSNKGTREEQDVLHVVAATAREEVRTAKIPLVFIEGNLQAPSDQYSGNLVPGFRVFRLLRLVVSGMGQLKSVAIIFYEVYMKRLRTKNRHLILHRLDLHLLPRILRPKILQKWAKQLLGRWPFKKLPLLRINRPNLPNHRRQTQNSPQMFLAVRRTEVLLEWLERLAHTRHIRAQNLIQKLRWCLKLLRWRLILKELPNAADAVMVDARVDKLKRLQQPRHLQRPAL